MTLVLRAANTALSTSERTAGKVIEATAKWFALTGIGALLVVAMSSGRILAQESEEASNLKRMLAEVKIVAIPSPTFPQLPSFEGWNLEPGVAQAHLVMVARVASISRLTVVEGAKTDVSLREYRFQPVRVLKGIFKRDQLSMTAGDLGCLASDGASAPSLQEGEFRLLILAQQSGQPLGNMGCVSAAPGAETFEQRVPLLTGADDPLVGVVETLIKVTDSTSRRQRAKLLIDRLSKVEGIAAVPLLTSLKLRSDWDAAEDIVYTKLARLARKPIPAVREAALDVLRDRLAYAIEPDNKDELDEVAAALREILISDEAKTRIRVDALESLGHLLAMKPDLPWAREFLIEQLTATRKYAPKALQSPIPETYAERTAAFTALSRLGSNMGIAEFPVILDALAALPLDEAPARELIFARAAIRLFPSDDLLREMGDIPAQERLWLDRLQRSIAARQSIESEADMLANMRSKASIPILLAAAGKPTISPADRNRIAVALGRLGDDRAIAVLADWLAGNDWSLKEVSLGALERIDSPSAAQAVRPLLKPETSLAYKLRMARLLARHGIGDGYSLAIEHLADAEHTLSAALVLAALDDPRTKKDLQAILDAPPDRRWRAAALTGLVAIGDTEALKQLREILADDRHPLAADAATAVALTNDAKLLPPLARLVPSRNRQIAQASIVALRGFLSGMRTSPRAYVMANDGWMAESTVEVSQKTKQLVFEAVAAVARDSYLDADLRSLALVVVRQLSTPEYGGLLTDLADQPELEGSSLLTTVQSERKRWK